MSAAEVEQVRAAAATTRAAATARFSLRLDFDFDRLHAGIDGSGRRPSDGSLGADLRRAATGLGRLTLKGMSAAINQMSRRTMEDLGGVLDLEGRRYTLSSGGFHQLFTPTGHFHGADDSEWREVHEGPLEEGRGESSPLWLLDVLTGAVDAEHAQGEEVRGVACHRFDVRVDLSVASRETPGGVAAPAVPRYEDLLSLPLTVWLGDGHVRRVVHAQAMATITLELSDHGTPIDPATWLRPPPRDP